MENSINNEVSMYFYEFFTHNYARCHNYFEPFEKSNADIWCGSPVDNTLFYKADGDQDRANTITLN